MGTATHIIYLLITSSGFYLLHSKIRFFTLLVIVPTKKFFFKLCALIFFPLLMTANSFEVTGRLLESLSAVQGRLHPWMHHQLIAGLYGQLGVCHLAQGHLGNNEGSCFLTRLELGTLYFSAAAAVVVVVMLFHHIVTKEHLTPVALSSHSIDYWIIETLIRDLETHMTVKLYIHASYWKWILYKNE